MSVVIVKCCVFNKLKKIIFAQRDRMIYHHLKETVFPGKRSALLRLLTLLSKREDGARRLQDPGNGFGLHCVNVSGHVTTGGLSTAEVEAHFNEKLSDMTQYDSFMDFSVTFYTQDLEKYIGPVLSR